MAEIDARVLVALYSLFSEETWCAGWAIGIDRPGTQNAFVNWLLGLDTSPDYVQEDLPYVREAWRRFEAALQSSEKPAGHRD